MLVVLSSLLLGLVSVEVAKYSSAPLMVEQLHLAAGYLSRLVHLQVVPAAVLCCRVDRPLAKVVEECPWLLAALLQAAGAL
jgi:hypothetical protein